jgi:toxin ParE1/3/4
MNYTVRFDIEAQRDLSGLYDYLRAEAGERTAAAYVNGLVDYCASFQTFPERGLRRDDLRSGLRIVGYRRKASIAFRIRGDVVTIMRIFNGGQEIAFSDSD